jgi:hypothetical protein
MLAVASRSGIFESAQFYVEMTREQTAFVMSSESETSLAVYLGSKRFAD